MMFNAGKYTDVDWLSGSLAPKGGSHHRGYSNSNQLHMPWSKVVRPYKKMELSYINTRLFIGVVLDIKGSIFSILMPSVHSRIHLLILYWIVCSNISVLLILESVLSVQLADFWYIQYDASSSTQSLHHASVPSGCKREIQICQFLCHRWDINMNLTRCSTGDCGQPTTFPQRALCSMLLMQTEVP